MNVEIGAEAAQFPEKEYVNGIAVAVYFIQHCFIWGPSDSTVHGVGCPGIEPWTVATLPVAVRRSNRGPID
jgi:hypothetical protein